MKLNLIKIRNKARLFYASLSQSPQGQKRMQNRILIFLPPQLQLEESTPHAAWLILDAEGKQTQCVLNGSLSKLQPGENDEIGVIVPAQGVLLAEAQLPRLSAYRLQQALPFALEEQVLEELELLHFVPGPYSPGPAEGETLPRLPVAVVKKSLLESWLTLLASQGIQPDWLTPAVFTLPQQENQWQLLIQGETATLRNGPYAGFSAETPNVETLLALKLGEEGKTPEKLVVYHDKKQTPAFSSLNLPVDKKVLTSQQALEQAAATLETGPTLNLLQGPYASRRKLRIPEQNKRAWLLVAYACAFWLGLLFISKLGSWMILSFEHHHLQSQIAEAYHRHFPQAKTVVDPKTRMEARLKTTLAQSEKNRLFQWLGYLAKTASSIRLQSLNFQNQQLSLELTASSFASLDDFILSLKTQGVEVKQQNAALAGNQVKAVLLIEGKPA